MKKQVARKAKNKINVTNLSDGRRLYCRIINDLQDHLITESEAKTFAYLLKGLAEYISVTELEQHLNELEGENEK
jgi:hypothetical protein